MSNHFSQNLVKDSIENELRFHKDLDTNRLNLISLLIEQVYDNDVERAQNLVEELTEGAKKLDFTKGKAHAIYYNGQIANIQSKYTESIDYFRESLAIYKSIRFHQGISNSLNAIGIIYYQQDNFDQAIEYFKKSIKVDEKINDQKGVSACYINIGNIYADNGDYKKALSNYRKALAIKKKIGHEVGEAKCYGNIGSIYAEQNNLPKALALFKKELSIYNKIEYDSPIIYLNIGTIYLFQEKPEKAFEYIDKALKMNRKQKNRFSVANCLIALGDIKGMQKNHLDALNYFEEALQVFTEVDSKGGVATAQYSIGQANFKLDRMSKALDFFERSLDLSEELGQPISISRSNLGVARTFHKQKKLKLALDHALKSQKISKELSLLLLQREAAELLSKIYEDQGDFNLAYDSYVEFKELNDSLFNKENIEKLAQLEYEYKYKAELDSAEYRELKLKKTVNSTSANLEKSQRKLLLGVIAFLVLSSIFGGVIFYLKLRNARAKNQNIANEQKLLRSQMTPHFIFNSLSVLQGMILNKEKDDSVNYLSKFSKLLRLTLENSRHKKVLLSNEIGAVENYIDLQNLDVRLPYACAVNVDKKITTDQVLIPPMLIQPFVENAFEHAFPDQRENRRVDINLEMEGVDLVCTIEDNGIGIDNNDRSPKRKNSLATKITAERLTLLSKAFKSNGSLKVEDRMIFGEKGTKVTLVIPHLNETP